MEKHINAMLSVNMLSVNMLIWVAEQSLGPELSMMQK